jgi:hypothetical protein
MHVEDEERDARRKLAVLGAGLRDRRGAREGR